MKKMDIRSFFASPKTSNGKIKEKNVEDTIPTSDELRKENKKSNLENEKNRASVMEDSKTDARETSPPPIITSVQITEEVTKCNWKNENERVTNVLEDPKIIHKDTFPSPCRAPAQITEEANKSNLESEQEVAKVDGILENFEAVSLDISPAPCTLTTNSVVTFESHDSQQNSHTDLGTLQSGPSQPHIVFPRTKFGNKLRAFSAYYYEKYSWLEYSIADDKIYCFVCRHFSKETIRDQNEKFTKSGFNNWKKTSEALCKHSQATTHIQCTEKHIAYQHHQKSNVYDKVISQHEQEVTQNRDSLLKIIDVMLVLLRQGLPFRGHREDEASKNRGNFLEITEMCANRDKNLSKHLENHIKYCSPKVQNEIIEIVNQIIIKEIVKEVKDCGFFSLMVDEARCYKEEQLSIVIRYAKNLEIVERFMTFIDCSTSRDAKSLATIILNF